jgi:hypothetical protein
MLREQVLNQYNAYPFRTHPYWRAVSGGALLHPDVAAAEQQHLLQLRAAAECERRPYLGVAGEHAFSLFLDQYLDALTADGAPAQLARLSGTDAAEATPATSASIALRTDIRGRGFAVYAVGFACVSHFYAQVCADAYEAYRTVYRFSEHQLTYYREHAERERVRANTALGALDELAQGTDRNVLMLAVRDAVTAASLGFDGMLQAAARSRAYWGGE